MTNDADVIGGLLTKLKWRVIIENCQKKLHYVNNISMLKLNFRL